MYSFNSTVRYSECDENAQLSILGLMDYLQDCSTFHSEHVGHGLEFMRQNHFAWFVAAWQIQIERMPRFTEPITIGTNCYQLKAAWAMRNFWIDDAEGNRLVKADSCWFTFDTAARTACRIPQSEQVYLDTQTPQLDLPKTRRHLKAEGAGTPCQPTVVTEQQLDTNHHMNNAQYVELAASVIRAHEEQVAPAEQASPEEQAPAAAGVGAAPYRICVQYKNMALLGNTIVPVLHEVPGGYTVDLAEPSPDGTATADSYAIVEITGR